MSEIISGICPEDARKVATSQVEWSRSKQLEQTWRRLHRITLWIAGGIALVTALGAGGAWCLDPASIYSHPITPGSHLREFLGILLGGSFCFLVLAALWTESTQILLVLILAVFPIGLVSCCLHPRHDLVLSPATRNMAILAERHRLPPTQVAKFQRAVRDLSSEPQRISASRFYLLNKLAFGKAYYPRAIRYQARITFFDTFTRDGALSVVMLLLGDMLLVGCRTRLNRNLRDSASILFHAELPGLPGEDFHV